MFSKFKSVFKKDANKSDALPFQHPKVQDGDMSECPFMKNKSQKTENPQKCPYNKQAKKNQKNNKKVNSSDEQSQEEEKPRGGCPFMSSEGKKKNPNLGITHVGGYDEPFVSKYKYYLSDSKINFAEIKRGKRPQPIIRQKFNKYPIYLKHTLFFNGEDFKKVRGFQCCSRFMAYEELRERGNKYFNKGKYSKSLQFYERAMSLFRWLQYDESHNPESSTQMSYSPAPSQTQLSEQQSINSKINLNFQSETQSELYQPNQSKELDEFETKYKEFFVVYSDKNVRYCNGEEMVEKPDIDMRSSLLIQLYLNMAAAYINLNHYQLASQVLNDALQISQKVSQVYLRKAQTVLYNKSASLQELRLAQIDINRATQMRPTQKIFQNTNPNILKMVNIHDAEQVYNSVAKQISQRVDQVDKNLRSRQQQIQNRLLHIKRIQQQIISQGKTPREGSATDLLSHSQDFKIISRMYSKYLRIIDFFNETKNKQQLLFSKKQFQEILRVLNEISFVENIQINFSNPNFGNDQTKVQNRVIKIKRQICDDIYNTGKFNFQVLQWAIKEIIQEEREQRKRKEEQEKKLKQEENLQNSNQFVKKSSLLEKLPYAAILVPVIGLAVNYLVF